MLILGEVIGVLYFSFNKVCGEDNFFKLKKKLD